MHKRICEALGKYRMPMFPGEMGRREVLRVPTICGEAHAIATDVSGAVLRWLDERSGIEAGER